jgi:hypothetical protein
MLSFPITLTTQNTDSKTPPQPFFGKRTGLSESHNKNNNLQLRYPTEHILTSITTLLKTTPKKANEDDHILRKNNYVR